MIPAINAYLFKATCFVALLYGLTHWLGFEPVVFWLLIYISLDITEIKSILYKHTEAFKLYERLKPSIETITRR